MASMDVPADRPVAVPAAKAVVKPQYITWLTLAFMTTASVASLRSAPTMAVYGLTCVFLYLVPAIIFLLPQSLVAAELASGWTGGVFRWVSEGMSAEVGPAGGLVPVRDDDLLLPDAAGVRREHAGLRLQPRAGEQRRLHGHRHRHRLLARRVHVGARRHRRHRQARLERPAHRHADPRRDPRDPRRSSTCSRARRRPRRWTPTTSSRSGRGSRASCSSSTTSSPTRAWR